MATQTRASGITVTTRGAATVLPAVKIRRARLGQLPPAAPTAKGRRRAAAAPALPLTEEEAVVNAMEGQDLALVDAIPLVLHSAAFPPAAPTAAARRRASGEPVPAPPAGAEVAVPLAEGESAVALVYDGGIYQWKLPDAQAAAPPPAARPGASARRRGPAAAQAPAAPVAAARVAVFTITPAPAAAPAPARRSARRGLLTSVVAGKAMVFVFRFLARPVLQGAVKFMERQVKEGLVSITAPDPQTWTTLASDAAVPLPAGRAAKVLMLVHGTFSSTVGSFGALAGQPEGRAFLEAALRNYDLVIGWDHATLSVPPSENAIDLAARLERIGFPEPPIVDAVSYSRGALVLRSLIEHVMPSSTLKLQVRRAVFVGGTNAGTELANPKNWHRLADRYTNLAAAGARAAALVPGFAAAGVILSEAIRGVGVLVKVIASSAVTDGAVPGLAAMEPDGPFVRDINGVQPGQPTPDETYYCAITSNFDPDTARAQTDPAVMPPGLLLGLADKATDALYGKPNDLVVNVDSMTQIDAAAGSFIRERLDFGTNGTVHHCAYFSQRETALHLSAWFHTAPVVSMAPAVVRAGDTARPVTGPVVVLRSTQPVDKALAQVKKSGQPWIVIERPHAEKDGKPVTLRYAHPAKLGEEWLREAMRVPGATVREAFELRETRRSNEESATSAAPAAAPPAGSTEMLQSPHGSVFRTVRMRRGQPAGVVPAALEAAAAMEAPPVAMTVRAAPPARQEVVCHFRAESDDEYVLEQVHTVDVTIARELLKATGRGVSQGGKAKVKATKPLIVECMPMLRVSLIDPDDARVEIKVPPAGEPAQLRFDLKGNEAGAAQVKVQVRQGPVPLVTLTLDLNVVKARTGTRRAVAAAADLAAFPEMPRAVDELRVIQMRPMGGNTQYRYELRLPSARVQDSFESAVLDTDPGAFVAALHKRIEARWAEHGSEKEAFARDLRAIGSELFDDLFPLELKQLLWKHRQAIKSVQVLSSEPFIPWELVLLRDPAERKPGPDAAFLGELGVVRWLVNGYPPEALRLRKGKARYVVPDYPPPDQLPAAQDEITMMKKRFGATPVAPEAEAVYKLLERPGSFDVLHFACHGEADAADIGTARLAMPGKPRSDGSTSEEDILATTVGRDADLRDGDAQPIVVLNACQSGRSGYTLKGMGGFAKAFIDAGAGVFVGSSWSVGDTPALAFMEEFYAQFVDARKPLATAAAAARKKARDDGDATWLAYVVYGHPRATVKAVS